MNCIYTSYYIRRITLKQKPQGHLIFTIGSGLVIVVENGIDLHPCR